MRFWSGVALAVLAAWKAQATTERDQDGENFNIGCASITDSSYPELFVRARSANAQIYQWHAAANGTQ